MAFNLREPNHPPYLLDTQNAPGFLADFIVWVHDFMKAIKVETEDAIAAPGSLSHLFAPEISFLPDALHELESEGLFKQAEIAVRKMPVELVRSHGLFGVNLKWKFGNVTRWLRDFILTPTGDFLARLIEAIDSLLESILDGAPVVGCIIELKDAIRNSLK